MTEQAAADLAGNYTRHRFAAELHESPAAPGPEICGNCHVSCEHLSHVPEFDFLGCDACLAEALDTLEAELLAETGCTRKEVDAEPAVRVQEVA